MMGAGDRPADQMIAWSDATGFLPPYFCRGQNLAGYLMQVQGAPGEDALFLDALREVLRDSNAPQFDFAALLHRSLLNERQAVLTWCSSADALQAKSAFEARRQPRGDVVAVRWWIPVGYNPWDHDPRFAAAPRLADVEGRDDERDGR